MRVYTKATPKLVELWKNYKGKKGGYLGDVEAFDNCDNEGNTGNFYACHTLSCNEYKTHDYKEVSEQEFIDVINNSLPINNDPVNNPSHYNKGSVECIDAIKSSLEHNEFRGYLKGNVQKYMWRYESKVDPLEDLKKAKWYLERLIKEVEG